MSTFHALRVTDVINETRDAIAVTFAVPPELADTYRYAAGQHLTVRTRIAGDEVRRSYSICAAAQDQRLCIAIKRVDGGLFSNWATDTLHPGQTLDVMPPSGHFSVPLDASHRKHYVGFAAGSGITPLLSIIETTLRAEPESRFTLFYGNRASSTVIFKEALEDLKDTYLHRLNLVFILSRETLDIDLFNGRLDGAKADALLKQWVDPASIDVAFICGPQSMMEGVSDALKQNGVDPARIKRELFGTSTPAARAPQPQRAAAGKQDCEVTVIQDGRSRSFTVARNAQTVLDAALEQGIELPYSCKGGVCSTCRCKRVSGEVDMDVNFALEDYEVARGFILSCQSYAVTDKLVLDFDQET
ncbi:1,2-phenylacetyl-CoA epoxidase subunit PaaE [Cupriavidus pauculus]|uniref:Phenylacetate-CoA oxygenase/reductase subunit PaaK n=1 Tax=Cupriavidus pauculus TaxID=82633 RepID=A0A2N5CAA4_9BURK|nr:1,2-phenylacetyl-CoA epoxidase subunit PaaE [Cupriavidus pauculus]PLP99104.1 phenylacetate-CoA oxygenase/reductase subunit PaaK [Cupriavidus pauculus]